MIKAKSYIVENYTDAKADKRIVLANLVADTDTEVKAHGTSGKGIIGLGENDTLSFGSTCMCVNGEFVQLGSNGQWK